MDLHRRRCRGGIHRVQLAEESRPDQGRLVVRRIPELNRFQGAGQPTLFDTHRFHAFFTTTDLDTVTADQTHRQHAIIEQVNADLKDSALAHLPSGIFTANAAWLVLATIAFNLSRTIGTLTGTELGQSAQRHHPPQTRHRPGPNLDLGPETRPAPAGPLALGNRMASPVRGGLRPAANHHHLTTQPHGETGPGTPPAARPDPPPRPTAQNSDQTREPLLNQADRWIEAKPRSTDRLGARVGF